MNHDKYKKTTKNQGVLDFVTLTLTIEELTKLGNERLSNEVNRILKCNKVVKPTLHNRPDDLTTNYYYVDLEPEDIQTMISLFGDLEVGSLGKNDEPTSLTTLYSSMVDKWNSLLGDS